MRSDVKPLGLLSPHYRAFREYQRALAVGALGEWVRRDEVARSIVRDWRPGIDPPEVAWALDVLHRGEANVIDLVANGTPELNRAAGMVGGWEFEAGALVASAGCVAAWWYREEAEAGGACPSPALTEESLVLGLHSHTGLWRVAGPGTPRSAAVPGVLLEAAEHGGR